MKRRLFLLSTTWLIPLLGRAEEAKTTIRGKLDQSDKAKPVLRTAEPRRIFLLGDEATAKVLRDDRLSGAELEASGRFASPDAFTIDPIHTKALTAVKNGKRLFITYWCSVCAIRSYVPGKCQCCQEETELDLRETITP